MEQLCRKIPSYRFHPFKGKETIPFTLKIHNSKWPKRRKENEEDKARVKIFRSQTNVVKFSPPRVQISPRGTRDKSTRLYHTARTYFFTKRIHEAGDKIKIERKIDPCLFFHLLFSFPSAGVEKKFFFFLLPSPLSQFRAARRLHDPRGIDKPKQRGIVSRYPRRDPLLLSVLHRWSGQRAPPSVSFQTRMEFDNPSRRTTMNKKWTMISRARGRELLARDAEIRRVGGEKLSRNLVKFGKSWKFIFWPKLLF